MATVEYLQYFSSVVKFKRAASVQMARKRRGTNRNPRGQVKRRKPSENPNGANVSESTKITDINMDCMEHILKDLSIGDLMSVADSCSRLREAAVFMLAKFITFFHLKDIRTTSDQTMVYVDYSGFSSNNLTMCLRFLRCFGHIIYSMTIDYSGISDTHSAIVDHYITKYCSETLNELEMSHARKQTMNHIQKPFSNVNFLQFNNCVLGEPLNDIAKWFPYAIQLTFCGSNQIAAHNSIPSNFQRLSSFVVNLKNHHKSHFKVYVMNLLRQHSCFLTRLKISGDGWNMKFLQNVSKHLQNIDTLDIHWTNKFSNLNGRGKSPRPIHFKCVTYLSIDFKDLKNQSEMPRIPFSFDRLESITIFSMRSKMNGDFLHFLGKQAYLKTFRDYSTNDAETIVDKMKLAKALSRLHVIYLPGIFSCDEAKYFLSQCHSLQTFNFELAETENIELLRENLDNNNWEINISGRLVGMKKRSQ